MFSGSSSVASRDLAGIIPRPLVPYWMTAVRASDEQQRKSAALLGLAMDNNDGHTRLTRGKNFLLFGGSHETHSCMQETAVKINEQLDKRGKRLENVSLGELRDICHEARDSVGDA